MARSRPGPTAATSTSAATETGRWTSRTAAHQVSIGGGIGSRSGSTGQVTVDAESTWTTSSLLSLLYVGFEAPGRWKSLAVVLSAVITVGSAANPARRAR